MNTIRLKQRKRSGLSMIGVGIIFVIMIFLVVLPVWEFGVVYYYGGIDFQNQVRGYFDLSDQASNATVKLQYWLKFEDALKSHGLQTGFAVIPGGWPQCACYSNPEYNLTNLWSTDVLTIQSRLQSLVSSCTGNFTCESSFAFTQSLNQIESTEVCWFPIYYYESAYFIQRGFVAAGWSAPDNPYLCSTVTT